MRGETRWTARLSCTPVDIDDACDGDPPTTMDVGGVWAQHDGEIGGTVVGGRIGNDRSAWPLVVTYEGGSGWMAESRCTRADGTVDVRAVNTSSGWAEEARAFFDGDRFAGSAIESPRVLDPQRWAAMQLR